MSVPFPTVERPVAAHLNTCPTLPEEGEPEFQQHSSWQTPRPVNRASTFSTTGSTIFEEVSGPRYQSTAPAGDTDGRSFDLRSTRTWIVEKEARHGYPKLASFLGGTKGYAIYRRFAALNARNLLYHQAQLTALEHELHGMEDEMGDNQDLHYRVRHVFHAENGGPDYKLHKKYEEIAKALDKYNHLLLDQQRLHKLPKPDDALVDSIFRFITSPKTPNPDWLEHPASTIYAVWDDDRKPIQEDLVTLNPDCRAQDPFTKFFTGTLLNWWHPIYARFKVRPANRRARLVFDDFLATK